jgi:pilus assembly protein CpaD
MTRTRQYLQPALALTALLGLSACATKVPDRIDNALTPTQHFEAKVVESQPEMRLAVHAQGLSANQTKALGEFVRDWAQAGGGQITLRAPTGGPGSAAAFRTAEGARAVLSDQGVPSDLLILTGYDSSGDPGAVLSLSYHRLEAVVPVCGKTWTNVARSAANDVQPNFGCAVTANMAAQIADPADLAGPRASTPADAGRRLTVLDKYRQGKVTSSEKDEQAKGAISDAVK